VRILFLSAWFPYPPDNGSRLRISNLLAGLAEKHQVDLVTFCDRADWQKGAKILHRHCSTIRVVPWKPFRPDSPRALVGFLSLTPRSLLYTHSPQMEQAIREELQRQRYDLVIASEITMAVYWQVFTPVPAILDDLELGALAVKPGPRSMNLHRLRRMLTWTKARRYVARLLSHFRACTVVSAEEQALVLKAAPDYPGVVVLPNCIEGAHYADIVTEPQWGQLIFPGALSYEANYDAVCFFLREIYARIREKTPEAALVITGRHNGVPWPPFPLPGPVQLTGWVEDVRPWIASSWAMVVPLRQGSGTRIKILESLALGTPVVSTHKGAEGLAVVDGQHLLLADSPGAFAGAVRRLLCQPALRQRLVEQGRALVREHYDWQVVMPTFLQLVERVTQ